MIAEKASDILRNMDTVASIKEYFKHLIAIRHDKFKDEEELALQEEKNDEKKSKESKDKKKA